MPFQPLALPSMVMRELGEVLRELHHEPHQELCEVLRELLEQLSYYLVYLCQVMDQRPHVEEQHLLFLKRWTYVEEMRKSIVLHGGVIVK